MSEKQQLPSREEVPTALKWDLTLLYPNDGEMQEHLQATVKKANEMHQLAGKLAADDGQTLLQVLQAAKVINEELEREYVYAFLRRDSDTTDAAATELYGKAATAATCCTPPLPAVVSTSLTPLPSSVLTPPAT